MIGQLWEKKNPENLCLGKRQGNIRKQSVGLQEHCSYPLEQFLWAMKMKPIAYAPNARQK